MGIDFQNWLQSATEELKAACGAREADADRWMAFGWREASRLGCADTWHGASQVGLGGLWILGRS